MFINQRSYLFLKTEGDSTNWSLCDSLHEMGGETSNLVAESLGLDNCNVVDDSLIYMEVGGQPTKQVSNTCATYLP